MRLFFALWPSPAAALRLSALAAGCAAALGGRATRRETIHLTLAFLGEVDADRLPQLIAAAHTCAARRFTASIDRLDYWRHNRLLWAGCSSPPPALAALALRLRQALGDAGLLDVAAQEAFVPHVTLVRKLAPADAPFVLPAFAAVRWRCSRFVLVESQRSAAGASYRRLADFALAD